MYLDPLEIFDDKIEENWVNYRGRVLKSPSHVASAEEVVTGDQFDFEKLPFRDANCFQAGNLHKRIDAWKTLSLVKTC